MQYRTVAGLAVQLVVLALFSYLPARTGRAMEGG
jgi:hypothetical protein